MAGEPELEERVRELLHVCEALRVVCDEGAALGLSLGEVEPLAEVAAVLARWVAEGMLRPGAPCGAERGE